MSEKTGEYAAVTSLQKDLAPPVAPTQPITHRHHCDARIDNYYWLRERDNPAVLAYLEAENKYTEAMLGPYRGIAKCPLRRDEKPYQGNR